MNVKGLSWEATLQGLGGGGWLQATLRLPEPIRAELLLHTTRIRLTPSRPVADLQMLEDIYLGMESGRMHDEMVEKLVRSIIEQILASDLFDKSGEIDGLKRRYQITAKHS